MSVITLAFSLGAMADIVHIVDIGETKESIAKKYGISEQDLIEANLDLNDFIYVGMELNIPTSAASISTQTSQSFVTAQKQDKESLDINMFSSGNEDMIKLKNYVGEAETAYNKGKYGKAAKLYTKAIKLAPSSTLYYRRGLAFYNNSNYIKAISDFNTLLSGYASADQKQHARELIVEARELQRQKEIRQQQTAQTILGVALGVMNTATNIIVSSKQPSAGSSSYGSYSDYSSSSDSDYSSDYSSSDASKSTTVSRPQTKCGACSGTGSVIKSVANFGIDKRPYCDECGRTVTSGHYHAKCIRCSGTGYLQR